MALIQRQIQRKTGVSWMAWVILMAMIALAIGAYLVMTARLKDVFTVEERVNQTWAILQTEKLSFLTTQRQEWRAQINSTQAAWFGVEEAQSTLLTDVFYGYDMGKLSREDIAVEEDGTVVIQFPPPEILTVSLRPETYDSVTKRTGLMKLKSLVSDGDAEMRKRLASLKREVLMDMLQNQHLDFQELEDGILQFLDPLFDVQGIPYRLEFPSRSPQKAILDYYRKNKETV